MKGCIKRIVSLLMAIGCMSVIYAQTWITIDDMEYDYWPETGEYNTQAIWCVNLGSNKFVQVTSCSFGRPSGDKFYVYNVDDNWNIISIASRIQCFWGEYYEETIYTNIPNGKALLIYEAGPDVGIPGNGGVLFYILGHANGGISYTYDDAGNRKSKTIIFSNNMASLRAAPSDVLEEVPVYKESIEYSSNMEKKEADILIYPNPTQGLFAVEINNIPVEISGEIYIFRSNGQAIEKKSIDKNNRVEFDISRESPGIYFVNIHLGEKVSSWKIIKK